MRALPALLLLLVFCAAPALAQKTPPEMFESFFAEMTIASTGEFYAYARNMSTSSYLIKKETDHRNVTEIVKDYNVYVIEPFFNRQICSEFILSGQYLDPPFYVITSKFVRTEMHLGVECDLFEKSHMPIENVTERMWFRKDTHIPVELTLFSFLTRLMDSFIIHSFSDYVPDSVFATPSDCKIYQSTSPATGLTDPALLSYTQRLPESVLDVPVNAFASAFHPATYTTTSYPEFDSLTVREFSKRLKSRLTIQNPLPRNQQRLSANLPEQFDWAEKAPQCQPVFAVRDQGKCGSCWAFGAVEALGDRYCIFRNKTERLSPQDLINCDKRNHGCDGGYLDSVWFTLAERGVTEDSCKPSVSDVSGKALPCVDKCEDGKPLVYFRAKTAYTPGTTEEEIMNDLSANGPLETGFWVFNDFQSYKTGVYRRQKGAILLGSHAVKIMGWGVENGVKYWKVQNSWGESWGEKGFFRIIRGENDCGMEAHTAGGLV